MGKVVTLIAYFVRCLEHPVRNGLLRSLCCLFCLHDLRVKEAPFLNSFIKVPH